MDLKAGVGVECDTGRIVMADDLHMLEIEIPFLRHRFSQT